MYPLPSLSNKTLQIKLKSHISLIVSFLHLGGILHVVFTIPMTVLYFYYIYKYLQSGTLLHGVKLLYN